MLFCWAETLSSNLRFLIGKCARWVCVRRLCTTKSSWRLLTMCVHFGTRPNGSSMWTRIRWHLRQMILRVATLEDITPCATLWSNILITHIKFSICRAQYLYCYFSYRYGKISILKAYFRIVTWWWRLLWMKWLKQSSSSLMPSLRHNF